MSQFVLARAYGGVTRRDVTTANSSGPLSGGLMTLHRLLLNLLHLFLVASPRLSSYATSL